MAEFIFKKLVSERGLSQEFIIDSSATSTEEIWNGIGNPVYPPARNELALHGISCDGKRAVLLTKNDYDKYDLFVGMDSANIRNMHRIFGGDSENKIHKLMEFTPRGGDVADPWYFGRFDITYRDVYEGCLALIDHILKSNNFRR
jgi:protein-tyrosine phosphatase